MKHRPLTSGALSSSYASSKVLQHFGNKDKKESIGEFLEAVIEREREKERWREKGRERSERRETEERERER